MSYVSLDGRSCDGERASVKSALISQTNTATIIAADSTKKIRVLSLWVATANTETLTFKAGAGGQALTGAVSCAVAVPHVLQWNPAGWFETPVNTLLELSQGTGSIQVSGTITYQLI